MKDHELLDLIGEADEDYVLAAGKKAARPQFPWKAAAAIAACAVLALGAYPVYRAFHPPLHGYTVVEGGGGGLEALDDAGVKAPVAPAGDGIDVPGQDAPAPDPGEPSRGNGPDAGQEYAPDPNKLPDEPGSSVDGDSYWQGEEPAGEVPIDEAAADQYGKLLQGLGEVDGMEPAVYPDWFAGAWIDHGGYYDSPAVLTVAIVDGLRTDELEAQIRGWCGGGVVFQDARYSYAHLDGLMEPVTKALDSTGLNCGIGVYVMDNCLGVDLYSNGDPIPDGILAQLARLDPDGDAIRVRLFTGTLDALTDDGTVGPAIDLPAPDPDEPTPTPVDGDAPVRGGAEEPADAAPGGAYVEDLPQSKGATQPAHYDLLPLNE